MNIKNYLPYFRDGTLINFFHFKNKIELYLESAELTDEDVQEEINLLDCNTIRGKFCLENVKNIVINDTLFQGVLKKEYDSGEVFDLEIKENILQISVKWRNYPPKLRKTGFSTIKIEAEKIWWQNIPDLQNPAW